MRRLIWLPLAGFLLVAGAAIAAASANPTFSPAAAVNADAASPAPPAAASPSTGNDYRNFGPMMGRFGDGDGLLNQVLSDLVKAGTITQAQADAISQALNQAVTDRQTLMQQQRQQLTQEWQQIRGFLSDGVITQDEIDQLPADSPLRQVFDSIAKDGKITLDQLQQLGGPGFGFGPGFGRGHGFGPGMGPGMMGPWGHGNGNGNQNPQASPSTTGSSS